MDPHLDDLHRQRDLVKQHLDWLDAQIASRRASAHSPASSEATPRPPASPAADPQIAGDADVATAVADYHTEAARSPARLKLGCWVTFLGALASAALVGVAWYWWRRT